MAIHDFLEAQKRFSLVSMHSQTIIIEPKQLKTSLFVHKQVGLRNIIELSYLSALEKNGSEASIVIFRKKPYGHIFNLVTSTS